MNYFHAVVMGEDGHDNCRVGGRCYSCSRHGAAVRDEGVTLVAGGVASKVGEEPKGQGPGPAHGNDGAGEQRQQGAGD